MATASLAIKLVYILGLTNLIGLLLVLFSCRCIMSIKPERLSKSKFYVKFYKYHCFYWWFFVISVAIHSIIAITSFGNPFSR